jgi:hypothetical protein
MDPQRPIDCHSNQNSARIDRVIAMKDTSTELPSEVLLQIWVASALN